MSTIRILYRDYDRAPYLYTLQACAKRLGLDVVLTKAELGGRFPEFLLEGATDFLAENYWQLQALRAKGQPLVSVATAVSNLNEKLFVHPSIAKIADLKGKKLAIRGLGPSQLIPGLWLKDHGLADDVAQLTVSEDEVGRWGQWKKVVTGECHGTFVTNFYQNEPRAGRPEANRPGALRLHRQCHPDHARELRLIAARRCADAGRCGFRCLAPLQA